MRYEIWKYNYNQKILIDKENPKHLKISNRKNNFLFSFNSNTSKEAQDIFYKFIKENK